MGKQSKNWINLQPRESVTDASGLIDKEKKAVDMQLEDDVIQGEESKENIDKDQAADKDQAEIRWRQKSA